MDYIVIFFLLFAVLAAGWFYLQRAKRRDAATTADSPTVDETRPDGG